MRYSHIFTFLYRKDHYTDFIRKDSIKKNESFSIGIFRDTLDILPLHLLALPKFNYVKKALELSERGVHIAGETLNKMSEIMPRLPYLKNSDDAPVLPAHGQSSG